MLVVAVQAGTEWMFVWGRTGGGPVDRPQAAAAQLARYLDGDRR